MMINFKNIVTHCLAATVLLGLAGCDLEEYNPSNATADAIWQSSPQGFQTLVNAAYSEQRYFYGKEDGILMTEGGTDLWFNANRANYANQLTRYESFTPISSGTNRNSWRSFWIGVNLTNAGITRINEVTFPTVQERNQREAELRFLRAFYYWHIVEFYGGVMRPTAETQEPILTATRASVPEFYDLIVEDLNFAAEHLPLNWGTGANTPYSRATRKAALGLLARAYLSGAYHLTGGARTRYFEEARNVATKVINEQATLGTRLHATPADLWDTFNNKFPRNVEALHIISNSTNPAFNYDNNSNRLHMWFLAAYSAKPGLQMSVDYGNDGQMRLMPTRALLDFFNEENDARYAASFQEEWYQNRTTLVNGQRVPTPYTWTAADAATWNKAPSVVGKVIQPGELAMLATKRSITGDRGLPYVVVDRDSLYNANGTIKGGREFPALKKFRRDPTRVPVNNGEPQVSSQPGFEDIMVIRLAEMYLIAAEAELQLNNTSKAAEHINVIRLRAAKPGREEAMRITPSQVTLDFILDERAREFAGEHMRWFDLKRTGKLVERVQTYNPDITQIQAYHVLRPIPQQDLDLLLNKEEFGQNFGYQ